MVVLTPVQQKAVDYVQESSKRAAYDEYPHLCTRVVKLGYTPKDLQKYTDSLYSVCTCSACKNYMFYSKTIY